MPAISSTAARKEASFALDGLLKPLIFLTNWSEAARTSSAVTGGSKLKRVLIFLHIQYVLTLSIIAVPFGRIAFANTDLAGIMDHRRSILEAERAVEQLLDQVLTE